MNKVFAFLIPFLIGCGFCALCLFVVDGSLELRVACGIGCILIGITIGSFLVGVLIRDEADREHYYSQRKAPDNE